MAQNETICPLCLQVNNCAMNKKRSDCWCMNVKIPEELLRQVPIVFRDKSCICMSCVQKFTSQLELSSE